MKIIIFGENGMIGSYLKKYLSQKSFEIVGLARKDFDIFSLDNTNLSEFLDKIVTEESIIINCAGLIPHSMEKYKSTEKMYYLVNSLFPVTLNQYCQSRRINFIHISSDCVFDGKGGRYSENDKPSENKTYGASKALGELHSGTTIRTSVIGEEKFNKRSLVEWVKSNKNGFLTGFDDHLWNGVTALELSKFIYKIIKNNSYWQGVRNIFSPQIVSKYELISMINEIYEFNITIQKSYSGELIDKSLSSIYESKHKIKDLYEQIIEMKNFAI